MNKFFDKSILVDRLVRLFLAFFCPPLAVADKGCLVFFPVFLMYLIQVTALGTFLVFSYYVMFWLFVECPLLRQVFAGFLDLYREVLVLNPDWIAQWLWSILCRIGYIVAVFSVSMLVILACNFVSGLISAVVNFICGFFPTLIAVIVCLSADEHDALRPEKVIAPIRRDGIFSLQSLRRLFIGANRAVLCYIYPPLAVSDMGWKKMLLVFLINLFGWYFGVAAVFFCVVKKYHSDRGNTGMKDAR